MIMQKIHSAEWKIVSKHKKDARIIVYETMDSFAQGTLESPMPNLKQSHSFKVSSVLTPPLKKPAMWPELQFQLTNNGYPRMMFPFSF